MQKIKLSLQPSESVVFQVAGEIYSAYIATGKVTIGEEKKWMERSLRESVQLAQLTDAQIRSDTEMD